MRRTLLWNCFVKNSLRSSYEEVWRTGIVFMNRLKKAGVSQICFLRMKFIRRDAWNRLRLIVSAATGLISAWNHKWEFLQTRPLLLIRSATTGTITPRHSHRKPWYCFDFRSRDECPMYSVTPYFSLEALATGRLKLKPAELYWKRRNRIYALYWNRPLPSSIIYARIRAGTQWFFENVIFYLRLPKSTLKKMFFNVFYTKN